MYTRRLPTYDPLPGEALDVIDAGWKRIVSEIGIRFAHDGALAKFREHGQRVEDDIVFLDPEFVVEQVAKTPNRWTMRARNSLKDIEFAPDRMVFCPVNSAPFVRDGDKRYTARYEDFVNMVRLTHVIDELDTPGYPVCDPSDIEIDTRHLDLQLALAVNTDKPFGAAQFNGLACTDSIHMAAILHGGIDVIQRDPVLLGVVNANSPLVYDTQMIDSMFALASHNQITVVTPFILMGAMGPVSLVASLAQQLAETMAGLCLIQLIRPGAPGDHGLVRLPYGHAVGVTRLRWTGVGHGPARAGQFARRYNLLWRSGGGALTSSQTADAQAAAEGLNTMTSAFLGGANYLIHCAGWLESGLVAGYEKFVLDVEMLRILRAQFQPLTVDLKALAFEAHIEVGHGGHFFGAEHTLAHYRDCFYRPSLFSTENFDRWVKRGALDTNARASGLWRKWLDSYEQPELDASIRGELEEFVARRKLEIMGA